MEKRSEKLSAAVCIILTSACCLLSVIYSSAVKTAVTEAVERCMNVIIPSLFAFMALSQIMLKSGAGAAVSKPFLIFAKIMGMPAQLFYVFIISSVAGYPVGIKLLADLKNRGDIDSQTANALSAFCYCGGPAFFSGTIGLAVFGDTRAGMLIFISVLSANFLVGCVICRIFKPKYKVQKNKTEFSAEILIDSVTSAGRSMMMICLMIVFCSALISLAEAAGAFEMLVKFTGISENALVMIRSCMEISFISQLSGTPYSLLPCCAAVCSFGGICVLVQAAAMGRGSINMKYLVLSRPVCAVISAAVCMALKTFFVPQTLAAVTSTKELVKFNNFVPSICLLLMIFLLNFKKSLVISKQL